MADDGYYKCALRKRLCAKQSFEGLEPHKVGEHLTLISDHPILMLRHELCAVDANDRVYRLELTEYNTRFKKYGRYKYYLRGIVALMDMVDALVHEDVNALKNKNISVRLVKILDPPEPYEVFDYDDRDESGDKFWRDYQYSLLTEQQKDLYFRDKLNALQNV